MAVNVFLNSEKKIRSIWWVVIFYLLLAAFLFSLIMASDQLGFEITMTHQLVLVALVSLICQLLMRKPISDLVGKMDLLWLKQLGIGLLMGAGLMALPALLLTIFGYIDWQTNVFSSATIVAGFSAFLAASMAEELIFRGFMFQRLIKAFGQWPAQLLMAGLFLLIHLNNPGMTGTVKILASLNIFIASIMFGLAYLKTQSLAMPFGLHFMANFMQGTVLGFGVSGTEEPSLYKPVFDQAPVWLSGGDFGIEASLLGLCVVIALTLGLYFKWPAASE